MYEIINAYDKVMSIISSLTLNGPQIPKCIDSNESSALIVSPKDFLVTFPTKQCLHKGKSMLVKGSKKPSRAQCIIRSCLI